MPDQPHDDQLTPDQEAQVRRLLAESRHAEPTPEAVVARLDRVLAGLADEPVREATVVRLADRRRKATTMLVAAAAVIVVGIGVGQVLPGGAGDEDSQTAGSDVSVEDDGGGVPESAAEADGEAAAPELLSGDRRQVLRVSSQRFARDAARLAKSPLALQDLAEYEESEPTAGNDALSGSSGLRAAGRRDVCEPGAWGQGGYVAVVYEQAPGWVILRRPQGSSQVVDLFLCGGETAVRSVTLPAP